MQYLPATTAETRLGCEKPSNLAVNQTNTAVSSDLISKSMEIFSKRSDKVADLLNEKLMFDVALGATILIWTIIGVAYCKLILGNRLAK